MIMFLNSRVSGDIHFFFYNLLGESIFSKPVLRTGAFRIIFLVAITQNSVVVLDSYWIALLLLVDGIDSVVCSQHPPWYTFMPAPLVPQEEYRFKGSVNIWNTSWLAFMSC